VSIGGTKRACPITWCKFKCMQTYYMAVIAVTALALSGHYAENTMMTPKAASGSPLSERVGSAAQFIWTAIANAGNEFVLWNLMNFLSQIWDTRMRNSITIIIMHIVKLRRKSMSKYVFPCPSAWGSYVLR
jgi:hypothetical protein